MENGWNLFNFNTSQATNFGRGHNSNNNSTTTTTSTTTLNAWNIWDNSSSSSAGEERAVSNSRFDWGNNQFNPHNSFTTSSSTSSAAAADNEENAAAVHALMLAHHHDRGLYGGVGRGNYFPDPHLMCLKLGKRHYFGESIIANADNPLGVDRQGVSAAAAVAVNYNSMTKKGKPCYYEVGGGGCEGGSAEVTVASVAAIPRCQVEGCNVALINAKDYHRRHKVCEMHSKAPKVVVLGVEQRFCQQCSRFHAVSEFDESKRSCRRRLAGHNERRRKSSHSQQQQQQEHSATIRNQSQVNNSKLMTYSGRHPYLPLNSGCALSLLSSNNNSSWNISSSPDLPTRCSAALRELIAENRAAILARQLILDKDWRWHPAHHPSEDHHDHLNGGRGECESNSFLNLNYQHQQQQMTTTGSHENWERMGEADSQVTLDLMQAPNSAFGFLSVRGKSKETDQECPELWSSFWRS